MLWADAAEKLARVGDHLRPRGYGRSERSEPCERISVAEHAGDPRDPQAAIAWLWKFVDAAETSGELYGRALVVIVAEQYATRLIVPASQRMPATR